MTNLQQHDVDSLPDGSSLLGLASWLDEVDRDLADLSARIRLSRMNEGEVYHTARTRALGHALSKVSVTVAELLDTLPPVPDHGERPEVRVMCMGLIAQWVDREARLHRAARAGMNGSTESFAIADVLDFLASHQKTGLLKVSTDTETIFLELADGDIIHASSDNAPAGERLGEVVVELGHMTREELRSVIGAPVRPRTRIGNVLLDRRLIDSDQLRTSLECQVRRILARLFQSTDALFEFHEEASHRQSVKVRLATVPLLHEVAATLEGENDDSSARAEPA